jgi:large subunit ribosomal protein L13
MQKTFSPKAKEITREWHVIDASGVPLGRLASQVAQLLRGKHKPTFAPHLDSGDHVIVINAAKVALTGAKLDQKKYYRHSGYPGGFKETPVRVVLEKFPERVVERAVRGMVPHTSLGKQQLRHLRVYAGPTQPHVGQVAQSRSAETEGEAPS